MTDQAVLGLVGDIPFVITRVAIASLRCCIPVVPGGDEATTAPIEARTARCAHRTVYLIGQAPTCEHHIRAAASLASNPSIPFAVDLKRLPWSMEPCP